MRRYSLPRLLPLIAAFTALALTTLLLSGSLVQAKQSRAAPIARKSPYPMPPRGMARVIAHKVRNDAEQVEWRWTVVTNGYWTSVSTTSDGDFELTGSDPSFRPDTANIFDLKIQTRSGKQGDGSPRLYLSTSSRQRPNTYRASSDVWLWTDGHSSSGGGENPLQKPVAANRAARALFTGDKTLPLPLKLPLYEYTHGLDGSQKVSHKVAYIVIPK